MISDFKKYVLAIKVRILFESATTSTVIKHSPLPFLSVSRIQKHRQCLVTLDLSLKDKRKITIM